MFVLLAGCIAKPPPPPPQQIVIEKTIVVKPTPLAPPNSKAGKAVRTYRQEERKLKESVSYPGATADEIRRAYQAERRLRDATQRLINRNGRATKDDDAKARDALDELRKARDALTQPKPP